MGQWVVSFSRPLGLVFAARPDWLTKVQGIVSRAISSALIARAGLRRNQGAQTGTITFVQRFGSAVNLNVHLPILVPDGAYTFERGGATLSHCGRSTGGAKDHDATQRRATK